MDNTDEQQAIIDRFKTLESGKAMLFDASAGVGKTTTGKNCIKEAKSDKVHMLFYSRKAADDLIGRLPLNGTVSGWHQFGLKQINRAGGRREVQGNKVKSLLTKNPEFNFYQKGMDKHVRLVTEERCNAVNDLVGMLKCFYLHPTEEQAIQLAEHYGITSPDPMGKLVSDALSYLKKSDSWDGCIDYDDMLRFMLLEDLMKVDFNKLICDECQDHSPVRTLIVKRLMELGMAAALAGDEDQSISGFAGADTEAMNEIKKILNPEIFPLTVNHRCDKNIIRNAQTLVPRIRYREDKEDGIVANKNTTEFISMFQPGDCAVARRNREIIPMCFKLIRDGKKATIQGKKFAEQLERLIKSFKPKSNKQFLEDIEEWRTVQLDKKNLSDTQHDIINDKYETLKYFGKNSDTPEAMYKLLETVFDDNASEYKLSTAHSAKGLEWCRVFVLNSNKFRMNYPLMKPWQLKQEACLDFVARTRAEHEHYNVN